MKTLIISLLWVAGLTATANAEIFRPRTAASMLVGGVAGAIIGEHNNHNAAEGALIGAAAGFLLSEATAPARQPAYAPPVPVSYGYDRTTCVQSSWGYGTTPPAVVIVREPTVVYRQAPRRVVYVAPAPVYCGPRYYVERGHHHHGHHRR